MKTTLRFLGLDAQDSWRRLVEQQLNDLESLTAVTAANVVLERQPTVRPAFRVQVLLEVSGPDLHAEATDHTRQVALLKATQDLERQIRARESKRMNGRKSHPQFGAISSGWTHALAGQKA